MVAWCWLNIYCVLSSYYILRPIRDQAGVAGGVQNLQWLFTATLVAMLVLNIPFAYLVKRLPRRWFIALSYHFFAANILLFGALFHVADAAQTIWIGRVFFVWASVFNLFVVSVFWSFMADIFRPEQATRLFSIVAAGGSTGAMVGPLVTTGLTYLVPIPALMLISAALLGVCWLCIRTLDRWSKEQPRPPVEKTGEALGGGMLAGMRLALSSPYLLGICVYLFLLTTTATFLYLEQTRLVSEQVASAEGRTRLFAVMDLVVNVLTFLTQLFITGPMISRFGFASALILLPAASLVGFAVIGTMPILLTFVLFTIVRRVVEYAVAKPAREVLFTVVSREQKYKAKNFIDTAVSRGGDAATGWIVNLAKMVGVSATQMAWALVPLVVVWAWLGRFLARKEEEQRLQHHEV